MRYLKKFEKFITEEAETAPAPATKPRPTTAPGTKPGTNPKPAPPSPIRRDKPAVDPAPMATAEEIANLFIKQVNKSGESVKKYIK